MPALFVHLSCVSDTVPGVVYWGRYKGDVAGLDTNIGYHVVYVHLDVHRCTCLVWAAMFRGDLHFGLLLQLQAECIVKDTAKLC